MENMNGGLFLLGVIQRLNLVHLSDFAPFEISCFLLFIVSVSLLILVFLWDLLAIRKTENISPASLSFKHAEQTSVKHVLSIFGPQLTENYAAWLLTLEKKWAEGTTSEQNKPKTTTTLAEWTRFHFRVQRMRTLN